MSLIKSLRRFDEAVARAEAGVAAVVLLLMIVVAVTQAVLRTLTSFQIEIANQALQHFGWADPVLQKGTMFLAFLGASLATHKDKHIGVDVVHRLLPTRVRNFTTSIISLVAGVTCIAMAYVFRLSITNNAADIPLDLSAMSSEGLSVHICTLTAAQAAEVGVERPGLFCAVRGALGALGQDVGTPTNALELLVPIMFVVMGIRFLARGIGWLAETLVPGSAGMVESDHMPGTEILEEKAG